MWAGRATLTTLQHAMAVPETVQVEMGEQFQILDNQESMVEAAADRARMQPMAAK